MSEPLIQQALNPKSSAVVEACAGSGKTWLLVSRILRLLLDGADPSEILAITFTRKAAQEMQARLAQWLRLLATKPENNVREFLAQRALSEAEIDALLPRARILFERTLTAQPGITINTFHGWFLELLKHAPLSSDTGNAALTEQASALLEEAWQNLADEIASAPESDTARHLEYLFREYGLPSTHSLLRAFIKRRTEWKAYISGHSSHADFALDRLRSDLGIDPETNPIADFFTHGGELEATFLSKLLAGGTDKQQQTAAHLHRNGRPDNEYFAAIRSIALTQKNTPVKNLESLARKQGDATEQRYQTLCERIIATATALTEQKIWRVNAAALACGQAYLKHYEALKQARGQMDFADIEERAWHLLSNSEFAEYMQYKLDARYRHILLDEFQDTNPMQWQILKAWLDASEAAGTHPTVFLVGDPKQSIYRFRGAEPRLFDLASQHLRTHYDAHYLQQNESRRCAQPIIDAVNVTLQDQKAFPHFDTHTAHNASLPGGVHLLPLAEPPAAPAAEQDGLRNPLHTPLAESPSAQSIEAQQVTRAIQDIVGRLPLVDGNTTRPAHFGDIMLLARSRTHLAHFEQAFKTAGIPYLTARRGGLLGTLEALDLTALLEFLVMPFADLKLAHVLRMPIFNVSDDDLLALSAQEERTWWQRLRARVQDQEASPALQRAFTLLDAWRGLTDRLPVHDLLDRIYFEGDVLAAYETATPDSMRSAVKANLLAFIELALKVQGGRYPSLPKFLEELSNLREAADEESPSEGLADAGQDAVHIHTVHGSKGLERPIVFLIDTHRRETARDSYDVLVAWEPGMPVPDHFSFHTVKDERGAARNRYFAAQQSFAETEYYNLLYVAMTRAKQYLIVSGSANDKTSDSWYEMLRAALPANSFSFDTLPPRGESAETAPAPTKPVSKHAQIQPTGQRKPGTDSVAQQRGIALHRMLEHITLPGCTPDRTAMRLELGLDPAAFDALWQEAEALVTLPELGRFFDPAQHRCAFNELAYINGQGESKRIDRLVEFENEVWILDYKMVEAAEDGGFNRHALRYRKQLEEYRQAMASIYPGTPIRCALIFTGGHLHEFN